MKKIEINKIREDLLTKTGIDFNNYNKPELFQKIADLLTFPAYGFRAIKKAFNIFFFLLLLSVVLWIFLTGKMGIGFVVLVIGFLLVLVNSLIWGQVILLNRTSNDICAIAEMSVDIAENAITDIQNIRATLDDNSQLPKATDLLSGAMQVVILPNVLEIVRKKVPLVGKVLAGLTENMLVSFTKKVSEKEDEIRKEAGIDKKIADLHSQADGYFDNSIKFLENVKTRTENIMDVIVKVTSFPFKTSGTISLLLSVLIIGGIFYLAA